MTCFSRICVTGETGYSVLITFASSSNVAYPRVVRHWRNRSSDFHRLCSSFVRRHSRSCGLVARVSFFCLQRGSGRLIKSNVAPNFATIGIILYALRLPRGQKIIAILPDLTSTEVKSCSGQNRKEILFCNISPIPAMTGNILFAKKSIS